MDEAVLFNTGGYGSQYIRELIMDTQPDVVLDMLRELLTSLLGSDASDEQIIRFWFVLGGYIGIRQIFPHLKIVVTPNDKPSGKEEDLAVVLLIGSPSEALVEVLAGDSVMKEKVMEIVLDDYRANRAKYI